MDTKIRKLERAAAQGDAEAQEALKHARDRAALLAPQTLIIDGESYTLTDYDFPEASDMAFIEVESEDGETMEFHVFTDSERAGELGAERWREMAQYDPSEFRAIVGDETLVNWALGVPAGPGSAKVASLEEWLEIIAQHPDEEWASYDHAERDIERVAQDIIDALGFTPTVAYRHN